VLTVTVPEGGRIAASRKQVNIIAIDRLNSTTPKFNWLRAAAGRGAQ
jgi:hypothetical protein